MQLTGLFASFLLVKEMDLNMFLKKYLYFSSSSKKSHFSLLPTNSRKTFFPLSK